MVISPPLSFAQFNSPIILPFGSSQPFITNAGNNPADNPRNPSMSASASSSTCSNTNLSDRFDSRYYLGEGKTSPNGKWKNVYSGYGSTGVEKSGLKSVFYLYPKAVTTAAQTEAALVKSTGSFCNYVVEFDMKTVKQLRQNSPPNSWEAGWFIFRYTDTFHYYWFLIRSDGFELGKKDCDTCTDPVDGQKFLVTEDVPTLKLNKWQHWKIEAVNNHIKVWVDNKLIVDFIDKSMSSKLFAGNIAMYAEDAYVQYDNMVLTRK